MVNQCFFSGKRLVSFITLISLLSASFSATGKEIYSCEEVTAPQEFSNSGFDTLHNDLQYMDVIDYGGYQVVFYTVFSSHYPDSYNKYLYYFIPGTSVQGQLNLHNDTSRNFKLKTGVYNDTLYLFYTAQKSDDTYTTDAIYYRTFIPEFSKDEKRWVGLSASDENKLAVAAPANISVVEVINGELFAFYTTFVGLQTAIAYQKSTDGKTFTTGENSFELSSDYIDITSCHGTVFQVPNDETGCVDKMAIGYIPMTLTNEFSLHCVFFDGSSFYGNQSAQIPVMGTPLSVRLATGSAEGKNNGLYSFQIWFAQSSGDAHYLDFFHSEYTLKGANGDQGSWGIYEKLDLNGNDDRMFTKLNADAAWAVTPAYSRNSDSGSDTVQMYLNLWYFRDSAFTFIDSHDNMKFRRTIYNSDRLVSIGAPAHVPVSQQNDMRACPVIGVVQGPPPFPLNHATDINKYYSSTIFGSSKTTGVNTSMQVNASMAFGYGGKFLKGNASVNLKRTRGFRYAHSNQLNTTLNIDDVLFSCDEATPGDLGWAMVFVPEVYNLTYILKSYDGSDLNYDDLSDATSDQITMSLIWFGQNSQLQFRQYNLQDPAHGSSYASAFTGMGTLPLSTDITAWHSLGNSIYGTLSSKPYTTIALPNLSSTSGQFMQAFYVKEETVVDTYAPRSEYTASAGLFGFTADLDISLIFSMKSSTTLTHTLGFYFYLPPATQPGDIVQLNVTPYVLLPTAGDEDGDGQDDGYSCSWISDITRNQKMPKPWCISYYVSQPAYKTAAIANPEMSYKKLQTSSHINHKSQDKSQLHFSAVLKDVPENLTLSKDTPVFLQLGSYRFDSEEFSINASSTDPAKTNPTIKAGKNSLILSNKSQRLQLKLNPKKRELTVKAKAKKCDLSELKAYGLTNKTTARKGDNLDLPTSLIVDQACYFNGRLGVIYKSKENRSGKAFGRVKQSQ